MPGNRLFNVRAILASVIVCIATGGRFYAAEPAPGCDIWAAVDTTTRQVVALHGAGDTDSELVDNLLRRAGRLQLRKQTPEQAERLLSRFDDDFVRSELMELLARFYARRGNLEKCAEILENAVDNGTNANNWKVIIGHGILEELCRQHRFADAIRLSRNSAGRREKNFLSEVATSAAKRNAWSVLQELLPSLSPEQSGEALAVAVAQLSETGVKNAKLHEFLDQAVSAIKDIEPASERGRACAALCPSCDKIGQSEIADRLMKLLDNDHQRAVCAMYRADGYAARRQYQQACHFIEQARKYDRDAEILGVVVAAAKLGDVRTALQLVRRYGQPGHDSNGLYRYELLTAALTEHNFEGALAVSHLLRTPYERARALLQSVVWFNEPRTGKVRLQTRIELVLAEVECLTRQIDKPQEQLMATAALAKAWHSLGDDPVAREILGPVVDSFLHELDQAMFEHSEDLISTIMVLDALEMKDERDAVLKICEPADALRYRIYLLCDSEKFEEALELIRTSQSPSAAFFEDEVLSQAASTPFAEWALDQAIHLPAEAESVKLDRILTVLEVITEDIQCQNSASGADCD